MWGRVDLWHEFLGEPVTEFSSATGPIPFTADIGDSWVRVGLGADMRPASNAALYGAVNYDTALNDDSHAFDGKIGIKVIW